MVAIQGLTEGLGQAMSKNGIILIAFAWVMEIVGVSGGIINSTYTTFGEDLPNTLPGYIPAVPMVALAVAELGRVPLASVIFHKHKLMQGIAILGIFALGYLAVENWTFGFERIVDLRLKPVNTARADALRAEDELSALVDQHKRMTTSDGQKRDELRRGINQRDASIDGLTAQLSKEAEIHRKNLEEIREACRIIRDKCIVSRSQAEDARYTADVGRLSAELARQRDERKRLQSQIDELVSKDASDVAELNQRIGTAERTVAEGRKGLRNAIDKNQIYRLASSWYGVSTSDVTAEQFATARLAFSTFSAIAVALAGSIAALVYYAHSRVPGAPSFLAGSMAKLLRARRAYFARKRKILKGPVRVEYRDGKEPPVVVKEEVVRWIDRIVLIPRWGIRVPTYINALIERDVGPHSKVHDVADTASNVMQLKKVN
jgi:hypothetical protein